MNNRMIALFVFLSLVMNAHVAIAQQSPATSGSVPSPYAPKFEAIPPGADRIETILSGAPAPFTGQLFDPATALRWGNYLQQCRVRLTLDVEAERKISELQVGHWQRQVASDREFYSKQISDQQRTIQELQKPTPWYLSPWTGFVAGIVVSGALVGMGAYLQK